MDGKGNKRVILRVTGTTRKLVTTIQQRQSRFKGHVLRRDNLEKACLLGIIEGTQARGRQRIRFLDSIKTLAGCRHIWLRIEKNDAAITATSKSTRYLGCCWLL